MSTVTRRRKQEEKWRVVISNVGEVMIVPPKGVSHLFRLTVLDQVPKDEQLSIAQDLCGKLNA